MKRLSGAQRQQPVLKGLALVLAATSPALAQSTAKATFAGGRFWPAAWAR